MITTSHEEPSLNDGQLLTYVFSYNRGRHLRNCVESLDKCAPRLPITIVDDHSDEPFTVRTLEDLSERSTVILPTDFGHEDKKTGRLYKNMNVALEDARKRGAERVLFIQDDMQIVRKITRKDTSLINKYFEQNDNTFQLHPCFRNRLNVDAFNEMSEVDASAVARFVKREAEIGKANFSAVGIFDVARFTAAMGSFKYSEVANSTEARRLGFRLGLSLYPFMHWTPYPISHRSRKRSAQHRLVEYFAGAGFHPIRIMSDQKAETLLEREDRLARAIEEFCVAPGIADDVAWAAGGGEYMLLARGGVPARLFKVLRRVRRSVRNLLR